MNESEWMPNEYEIDGFVDGCEQHDRNYVLLRYGKQQQKKLLSYQKKLSAQYSMTDTYSAGIPIEEIDKMLKELEK